MLHAGPPGGRLGSHALFVVIGICANETVANSIAAKERVKSFIVKFLLSYEYSYLLKEPGKVKLLFQTGTKRRSPVWGDSYPRIYRGVILVLIAGIILHLSTV